MSKKTSAKSTYNLSEGSKIAGREFTEASQTASLFYQRFKQIMGYSWERKRLAAFRNRILGIIRTGPAALNGQRRFWDGDIHKLWGYELNPRTSVSNIFPVNIEARINPLKNVRFKIPSFNYENTFKHHKDVACAELKLYFLAFDLINKTFSGKSIIAFSQERGDDINTELNIDLPIADIDNQLLVLIKHVYFKREGPEGRSVIRNMHYMAAQIISITYIKDGAVVSFTPEKKQPVESPEEKQGVWLNID